MTFWRSLTPALIAFLALTPAWAETQRLAGDIFAADGALILEGEPAGDIFAVGETVTVRQAAEGTVHAAGRRVELAGPTAGNIYTAAMTVQVSGAAAGRLYALGYEVRLLPDSRIGRGARLAGRTVAVGGQIDGTLMAGGEAVALDAVVRGDAYVSAETLTLSPDARITGNLYYRANSAIDVPQGAVLGDVIFDGSPETTAGSVSEAIGEWGDERASAILVGGLGSFFVICQLLAGIVVFVFMPGLAGRIRTAIEQQTGANFLWGVAGLGVVIGAILLLAVTLIGLPIALILALALPFFLITAFAIGAVGWIILAAKGAKWELPFTLWTRLLIALAAVVPIYLLSALPLVGWVVMLATTIFGLGALLLAMRDRPGAPATA